MQLQLVYADLTMTRHLERLDRPKHQRPGALNVKLPVEGPQLSLGRARVCAQPPRRGAGAAERRLGERKATEQMIPIGVCREQAARSGEAGLIQ